MVDLTTRDESLRRWATAILVVAAVVSVATACYGILEWVAGQGRALGVGFIVGGAAGLLLSAVLYCQMLLMHKFVNYAYRSYDALLEVAEALRRQEEHSRVIAEHSSLSEWAKRVVYREKDYEFLRDTIQAAIVRQDWAAAEHLIRDMEKEFGYHDEAAHLREKLDEARRATTEERIAAAVARVGLLCDQHKWQQAVAECERLNALFPGQTSIAALPREIERRRQDVKQKLLRDYEDAVRAEDVEKAHRLLFMLDQYLLPKEAEPLKESARSVFRARLEQLRAQFTIAVSYKHFREAIEAGERLQREFPNSGYAQEISKLLPVLRQRASQQSAYANTARPAAS